jgi:hypothetical protein
VFTAEREVAAASADVGNAQAQRYPRLSLSGSVGVANFRAGGDNTKTDTWTIGPLAISVPSSTPAAAPPMSMPPARATTPPSAATAPPCATPSAKWNRRWSTSTPPPPAPAMRKPRWKATAPTTAPSKTATRTAWPACSNWKTHAARLAAEQTVINLQRERSAAWVPVPRRRRRINPRTSHRRQLILKPP